MAKFVLILRSDITQDYSAITPDQFGEIIAAYGAWAEKLAKEGRLHLGRKLTDEGGRVLAPENGGAKVTAKDGPYVETKEVVGGIYVIEADSYDHAALLCKGHPNFRFGSIEIREIDFMGQPES
jgi:hypothetical protein